MSQRGELFSSKVTAESERRTYFFNVKENRKGDRFLTVVESTKQPSGEFERHQIFVYEEDLSAFLNGLDKAAEHVRRRESPRHTASESGPAPRRTFRKQSDSSSREEHSD